jgi:Sec-independent protein translocase protein TatA
MREYDATTLSIITAIDNLNDALSTMGTQIEMLKEEMKELKNERKEQDDSKGRDSALSDTL